MKSTIGITCFFLVCATVIALAIRAGMHHEGCTECKLGLRYTNTTKR